MASKPDGDASAQIREIHERVRERGIDGDALVIQADGVAQPSVIYWDEQTEQWLTAIHDEGRWHKWPRDEFPAGYEPFVAWGDHEWAAVEDTELHHATYGLDPAREGDVSRRSLSD